MMRELLGDDETRKDYQKRQNPSTDADAFDKVGNIGLGDIEISSELGKHIYVCRNHLQ